MDSLRQTSFTKCYAVLIFPVSGPIHGHLSPVPQHTESLQQAMPAQAWDFLSRGAGNGADLTAHREACTLGSRRSLPVIKCLHSRPTPPPASLYHLDEEFKIKTLGFRGRKQQPGFPSAEGRICSPSSPAGPPQCRRMSFLSVLDRSCTLWSQSLCSLKMEKLHSDIHLHVPLVTTLGKPR